MYILICISIQWKFINGVIMSDVIVYPQVERKRHIGNDIVNIVYVDGGTTQMSQFNPAFIKSQFTRIL